MRPISSKLKMTHKVTKPHSKQRRPITGQDSLPEIKLFHLEVCKICKYQSFNKKNICVAIICYEGERKVAVAYELLCV